MNIKELNHAKDQRLKARFVRPYPPNYFLQLNEYTQGVISNWEDCEGIEIFTFTFDYPDLIGKSVVHARSLRECLHFVYVYSLLAKEGQSQG